VNTFSPSSLTFSSIIRTNCAATGLIRYFLKNPQAFRLIGGSKKGISLYIYACMHKPFFKLKALLSLAILLAGIESSAQTPNAYEVISTAQGLSQGMVFDLLQDKEGFIWVATKNGLNRYDGYSFKIFANDPYNAHSLSSNTIVKLFEDSKGRIWIGTENAGVNIYDKKSGKFFRITHNASDPASLSGNGIRSILEMPDGRMLVATDVAGLNIVEPGKDFFTKDAAPVVTRLTLPNDAQVYGMGTDNNKIIWIGGMDGSVYRFDPLKNNFIKLNNGILLNDGYLNRDSSKLINNNLYLSDGKDIFPLFDSSKTPAGNIIFKPKEQLWENHHREEYFYSVYKYGPGKAVNWNEPLPVTKTRLNYPFIIDRSGVLWSGSVGYGLRKYSLAGSRFKTLTPNPGASVKWIIPVKANDIFLGDFAYGWGRLIDDSIRKNAFGGIAGLTQVDNFIISQSGDYWLKSDHKGYFKYNPASGKLIFYPQINDDKSVGAKQPMLEDSKGNIWLAGLGGKFTRINTVTGSIDSFTINNVADRPIPPKSICTALYEDKQGICWIGTPEGFVKVIFSNSEKSSPRINWFYNNSSNRNSLNYNHVSCFLDDPADPTKYLWIATKGGGLNRLDKTTGDFFHLTTKDGLPDDVVYGILPDDAGNIWGSTNKGIFCLTAVKNNNNSNWVFHNFTKSNGLQDDEFNTGSYAKLPNGNLAFGGVNGLNIFDPREILVPGFMPNVFITDILINNQSITPGDKTAVLQNTIEQSKEITLTHLQDILTLEFSSLDLTASAQNKYRYQLAGVDKDWVESGTRRTATYLHLPTGNYTFKVQGSNSQGIWSDKIAELKITVLPPWWRTWWAYAAYILAIILIIRAWFKFSINRAKLKSQLFVEQNEAKRAKELDHLKTQLYTNITHEFRTPLTVILGMAQQIASKPDEHLKSGTEMIIRNGQSLLNLVNEMLDLSKLESGKMSLQLIQGDIINFLRYIVESFHSLAESQNKQLHFLSEIDSLHIDYDPEKMRQIVANLLSNALKFTPEKGNIYLSVNESSIAGKENQSSLVIKVKDTGIGIPEDQMLYIFDRFYQSDNSHTRKTEGTGIGLALTRELVKLMEGEISVKSPPTGANKGSEFTVMLPFKRLSIAEHGIAYPDLKLVPPQKTNVVTEIKNDLIGETAANEKPLILLVEDNADVVAYTASCLPDYRLAVGKDGMEGLEIAADMIPDLIITDVMMPLMDGFELCHKLRNDELTSHIPIIMLTAKADMASKMEGLERGADVYLEKPFNREELLIRIKKLLELRKHLQQYYLKKAGLTDKPLPIPDIPADDKTEDIFVKKVREAVEAHLADIDFSVEQLCKQLFMSHSQLHRKLEALTGCSPNKFIRIIRLNKAKELLKDQENSIGAIALDCGYNDPGYFARVFKQENGITPQEWRIKYKAES
jgi:signal transduction histidine kinase/DNA-binding response OmpR family regulator/ligand-binding sensor domain-containing protein